MYANFCNFRGTRSLHLVLETEHGLMTVFVVPKENSLDYEAEFHDDKYQGRSINSHKAILVMVFTPVSARWLALDNPAQWLWSFVGGAPKINHFSQRSEVPAVTDEATAMSKALKKAGFTFVGPTICYAYMQATGMVMDHTVDCDRYAQLTTR